MGNVIIGIHGLSNKPNQETLSAWWEKSIREGLRKNRRIPLDSLNFELVYWADALHGQPDPHPDAYREAKEGDLKRYKDSWLDSLRAHALDLTGDVLDFTKKTFGIDAAADQVLKSKLPDLHRYYTKKAIRDELRKRLAKTLEVHQNDKIMVVAHSMGSIIAYDVLRAMGHASGLSINHFVTIGSPLGLPHMLYKIRQENILVRTPSIVRKWTNLADRRDPVAVDIHLQDDYEANDSGVRVADDLVMNDWGGIHHKSYGYLRTPEFSDLVRSFI